MGELQEYKCPCCGGGIRFDSKAQKLKCPFCDTEFEMEVLQQYDATLKQEKKLMQMQQNLYFFIKKNDIL